MAEPDVIYVIIGDNGYGMTIKLDKVRKIMRRISNPFIKKFYDALSGYVWLSSQINDYNEDYYESSRLLESEDLVSLDELIRKQCVIVSGHKLEKRRIKRAKEDNKVLRIGLGKPSVFIDVKDSRDHIDKSDEYALAELEDEAKRILSQIKKKRLYRE